MDHTDLILALDKQQSIYNPDRVKCSRDDSHGAMLPLRDGVTLACCKCGDMAPASLRSA